MKIELKAPIQLPVKEKTILRPGVHNIPDDVFAHWFLQGKVKEGIVVVIGDNPSPAVLPKSTKIKPRVVEIPPKPVVPEAPKPAVEAPKEKVQEPEKKVEKTAAPETVKPVAVPKEEPKEEPKEKTAVASEEEKSVEEETQTKAVKKIKRRKNK